MNNIENNSNLEIKSNQILSNYMRELNNDVKLSISNLRLLL